MLLLQRLPAGVLLGLNVLGVQLIIGLDVVADAVGHQPNELIQPDGVAGTQLLLPTVSVQLATEIGLFSVGALAHRRTAVGALHQPGQQVGLAGAVRFGAQPEGTLDGVEGGSVDDGLMSAFHPVPLVLRRVDDDLGFVAHLFPPPLDHHPSVHLVGEDAAHRHLVPQAEIILHGVVAGPAPFGFVAGGIWNALLVQQIGDVLAAVAFQRQPVDLPHHLRRLEVGDDVVFVRRVFAVTIDGEAADVLALPSFQVKHHADVLR